MNDEDRIIIWEAPKIVPPEFRLYYDDSGKVLFYTCEKPAGNYIVIDAITYASARYDLRVVDGKISVANPNAIVYKLMPSESGTKCSAEDISIIADDQTREVTFWDLKIYEL